MIRVPLSEVCIGMGKGLFFAINYKDIGVNMICQIQKKGSTFVKNQTVGLGV
jgi:hypothetical protein